MISYGYLIVTGGLPYGEAYAKIKKYSATWTLKAILKLDFFPTAQLASLKFG